jgi:hypothetical protein
MMVSQNRVRDRQMIKRSTVGPSLARERERAKRESSASRNSMEEWASRNFDGEGEIPLAAA